MRTREEWASGYGPIQHSAETRAKIADLASRLGNAPGDGMPFYDVLYAADRFAAAGMWLVVHMTYAARVHLDGRDLRPEEFKADPEGHTGGSLNMVPAYVGYLAANVLSGTTRSWVMGQGHCVAAIYSANLLASNQKPALAGRYDISDQGLTRFVQDFYSYKLASDGRAESPLGSHVNAATAGGTVEGGYLGFTELQYVHMPLPGETVVAFLSDGAWEEQRGSDWAPRWWRVEDSGFPLPIMIHNGRRIDQRTTMQMEGGPHWFEHHLQLNDFDPIPFDGRDPAAFVCTIFEMERRLAAAAERIRAGDAEYPVRLPYGVAIAPKGAGFTGEGTNAAHNLPLGANPHDDPDAARRFNESARKLWVPLHELQAAVKSFNCHQRSGRVRERDHALATRAVKAVRPAPGYKPLNGDRSNPAEWTKTSAMSAIDSGFLAFLNANPELRPRVGNPDEMESNRMTKTLAELKFRVTQPEPGRPEDVHGAIVAALNEEAIGAAAVGNKGGINLIVTYEAFADKMYAMLRQEVTFSNGLSRAGDPPRWLSLPVVLTSQTWENSKNEYSHQNPTMPEAMMGETCVVSRVVFPADYNTALVTLEECYSTQGQIWTIVAPKGKTAELFAPDEARNIMQTGAARLEWLGHDAHSARLILVAMGAYQLGQVVKASFRLRDRSVPHSVVYIMEPGKLRTPRSRFEQSFVMPDDKLEQLFPESVPARVFVTHTRPEPVLGALSRIHTGRQTTGIGFRNDGGTLDVNGMLWVNGCTWAHCLRSAASVMDANESLFLDAQEIRALNGEAHPEIITSR